MTPVRIAIGQFMEESNTFVRQQADLDHFRATQLLYGDEILPRLRGTRAEVGGFLDVLVPAGAEVVPTIAANAVSSGPVTRQAFDHVKDALLERLAAAGRLDGVLLALHGAMVLEDAPDGEGELLAAVRKAIGPAVPLVATLDLHATITARMVQEADALVGYDTYPHIDLYETGAKAASLILRAVRGEVRPVTLFARAPMLVPAEGQGTSNQPMAGLMAEAKRLQARPGVLAVSLFPVQPWLDIPDTGFSVMAVADGPRRAAEIEPMIRQLAWQAWERRRGFAADLLTVDDAIRQALAAEGGPFILSESADSTGSGSPGDSAHVLERLLALDVRERCLVTVVDAPAVARAIAAGVGARGDHHRGRHARPALQPAGPAHRAGPHTLRRPLHLVGQEVARRRVPDGARGRRRGGAHRHPGDRAARVHLRPGALPLRRPRAAGREDRGGEVAAPVPRRLRRLRPGVLGRRHARAQHGARRAPRVASPLAPALPLRRRLRARDPRGRRGARRDSSVTGPRPAPVPIFRWSGALWGFVDEGRLFDRFGRQVGWIEPVAGRSPDVFDLTGRFLGELFGRHYVMRYALREEPIRRSPRVRAVHPAPPDPLPARDPRTPIDDWNDGLPWPLSPPDPPAR